MNKNKNNYQELKFKNNNQTRDIIIILLVSIIIGGMVFYVSNLLIGSPKTSSNNQNNKTEEDSVKKIVSIKNNLVKDLYSYVRYGEDYGYDLFVKNKKVTRESVPNNYKFLYAFQFSKKEDLRILSTKDNKTLYGLTEKNIAQYIKDLFGSNIKYNKNVNLPIVLDFKVDEKNTANLKYNEKEKIYELTITDQKKQNSNLTKPYYRGLANAYKDSKDNLYIIEKVIYVDYVKNTDNTYNYTIYQDYNHKKEIIHKENINLEQNKIDIVEYSKKAATITYKFVLENEEYFFESSKISY